MVTLWQLPTLALSHQLVGSCIALKLNLHGAVALAVWLTLNLFSVCVTNGALTVGHKDIVVWTQMFLVQEDPRTLVVWIQIVSGPAGHEDEIMRSLGAAFVGQGS